MKIRNTALILATAVVAFGCQSAPRRGTDVGISGFEYVRDLKKFSTEDSKEFTPETKRALKLAKGILALRLEREIEGEFSIAAADWGYQVDFSGLKSRKDGVWTEEAEGFGEVFLSKSLDRIVVNYGP